MRITAALLALVTVSTGCVSTTARNAGIVCASAGAIAVASAVATTEAPRSESEPAAPPPAFYVFLAAVATVLVSGTVASVAEMATTPYTPPPLAATAAPSACAPGAEQLTREAQQAAGRGQCAAVQALGDRVRDLDPGCYAVQFAVIRCTRAE